jgi:hypothetical protein
MVEFIWIYHVYLFLQITEKLVVGESKIIKVNVTNTGSTTQSYHVTATSAPTGIITSPNYTQPVGGHTSKEINIELVAATPSIVYAITFLMQQIMMVLVNMFYIDCSFRIFFFIFGGFYRSLSVKLGVGGKTLQTIRRTFTVSPYVYVQYFNLKIKVLRGKF